MSEEFVKVAKIADIPATKGKVIRVLGKEIALFQVEGGYYALDNLCPHEGGPLAHGWVKNGVVTCPWHLWEFDLRSGEFLDEREIKVACFQVKVEGDDLLLDIGSLTAHLRLKREALHRLAAGESAEGLAHAYQMTPEVIEQMAKQIRIGERLVWLGELFMRQGAIYSQDILQLPYRDLEGISYGALEKIQELTELL